MRSVCARALLERKVVSPMLPRSTKRDAYARSLPRRGGAPSDGVEIHSAQLSEGRSHSGGRALGESHPCSDSVANPLSMLRGVWMKQKAPPLTRVNDGASLETVSTTGDYALPKMRLTLVPHVGQMPCAMRRPDSETFTCPLKERFSLHLTQ